MVGDADVTVLCLWHTSSGLCSYACHMTRDTLPFMVIDSKGTERYVLAQNKIRGSRGQNGQRKRVAHERVLDVIERTQRATLTREKCPTGIYWVDTNNDDDVVPKAHNHSNLVYKLDRSHENSEYAGIERR